ncbi:MAG: acyl-protein synthetase [Candidatus Woesearchaeota archaeon]|nr:acyl-protein synthetase [Candidatus Woesearchaeota archaeon]
MQTENLVQDLVSRPQYSIPQAEKEKLLLKILKAQITDMNGKNRHLKSMYSKLMVNIPGIKKIADIPFIPVQMFKKFDLTTCNKADIVRTLKSSSTTGQNPSKISIDKITASRQTKALTSILSSYLGNKRRPFLVIDTKSQNVQSFDLTARGAAIRGLSTFAKSITYALKETPNGGIELDIKEFKEFCKKYKGQDVYVFGFTYIIWTKLVQALKKLSKKTNIEFKSIKIFHSGGWKKLKDQSVSEETFSAEVAKIFNTKTENIFNFYGMAEQTGVIFIDCRKGFKHIPNFADVIIRNPLTLGESALNQPGPIEIVSILGNSYPSQALLTEDIGILAGIDNCPCSRKGKYIKFKSRVEKAEIRGCGDTFEESDD